MLVIDESGDFVLEARAINAKALLACKTVREAEALSGYFLDAFSCLIIIICSLLIDFFICRCHADC